MQFLKLLSPPPADIFNIVSSRSQILTRGVPFQVFGYSWKNFMEYDVK
jgi:hypothetical protein